MKFTFVTLFKELISGYFSDSILSRAIKEEIISVEYINPRDYTEDKHNRVDAPLIGGGAGMLLTIQPIYDALKSVSDAHIVFLTPVGKQFNQNDAKRLAKKKHIVLVCGRYEGFDERLIEECADEVFSVGEYVLTGGELPSLIVCDAVSRCVPNVLGNEFSLSGESFSDELLEAPNFAKPKYFEKNEVPSVLFGGNHAKIMELRNKLAYYKTKYFKPS